jgi:16S rRNA (guanine527-N7)-methyltransferase
MLSGHFFLGGYGKSAYAEADLSYLLSVASLAKHGEHEYLFHSVGIPWPDRILHLLIHSFTHHYFPYLCPKPQDNNMEQILKYFPNLSEHQIEQFQRLGPLYEDWNSKINVISRKDIEHLYERHILHSLAIAKIITFQPSAHILDLGTGGGFPGIPLAILFPETEFLLIDGIAKKIKVVNDVVEQLGLQNVTAIQARAEELKNKQFDFVVTRAVAKMDQLFRWTQRLYAKKHLHALPNGMIALKGGNVKAEIKELPKGEYTEVYPLPKLFKEAFFEDKFIVYLQG